MKFSVTFFFVNVRSKLGSRGLFVRGSRPVLKKTSLKRWNIKNIFSYGYARVAADFLKCALQPAEIIMELSCRLMRSTTSSSPPPSSSSSSLSSEADKISDLSDKEENESARESAFVAASKINFPLAPIVLISFFHHREKIACVITKWERGK